LSVAAAVAAAAVGDGNGWNQKGLGDGGMPASPPSPLGMSQGGSGRKGMHYMKNAVMTGTRRIARHVPMSIPNSKTIQRHIPIPKGVPKLSKYNPYKRSTNRRNMMADSAEMDGFVVDASSGSYGYNESGHGIGQSSGPGSGYSGHGIGQSGPGSRHSGHGIGQSGHGIGHGSCPGIGHSGPGIGQSGPSIGNSGPGIGHGTGGGVGAAADAAGVDGLTWETPVGSDDGGGGGGGGGGVGLGPGSAGDDAVISPRRWSYLRKN
ncbi:unnamed protein product, partial [Laminaria digitata]